MNHFTQSGLARGGGSHEVEARSAALADGVRTPPDLASISARLARSDRDVHVADADHTR
jgi:hypothetical protein